MYNQKSLRVFEEMRSRIGEDFKCLAPVPMGYYNGVRELDVAVGETLSLIFVGKISFRMTRSNGGTVTFFRGVADCFTPNLGFDESITMALGDIYGKA